jgi:hypothetical protein
MAELRQQKATNVSLVALWKSSSFVSPFQNFNPVNTTLFSLMFGTAITSTRPALLRAKCSCSIYSFRQNAILKRHASRSKDVDPHPAILKKRTRASRSKDVDPNPPILKKRPLLESPPQRYLIPLPASAEDLPSIPSVEENVPSDNTDTEALALLSSITSAPKQTSKLDKTNDVAIYKKLKKAYSRHPKTGGMRNDKRRVNIISSSLCGRSLLHY